MIAPPPDAAATVNKPMSWDLPKYQPAIMPAPITRQMPALMRSKSSRVAVSTQRLDLFLVLLGGEIVVVFQLALHLRAALAPVLHRLNHASSPTSIELRLTLSKSM